MEDTAATHRGWREPVRMITSRWVHSRNPNLSGMIVAVCVTVGASLIPSRAQSLLAGTTLPVRLQQGLSTQKNHRGEIVRAGVIQAVPLGHNQRIPKGAIVSGHIVAVNLWNEDGSGPSVTLKFEKLKFLHQEVPLVVGVRAMASFVEVESTAIRTNADEATPPTTRQIGGDVVYRGGGPVTTSWGEDVGKPVADGVLVRLLAPRGGADTNKLHCGADESLHALGPFASEACGVYGFPDVRIGRDGFTEPRGEITIVSSTRSLKLASGTELLLQVVAP